MADDRDDLTFEVRYESPLDRDGWTVIYHRITLDRRISDGAYRLYLLLHRYAQSKSYAWPSRETLAREMGVSVETIRRRLKELTQVGLIERRKERFGGTSVTYLLNPNGQYLDRLREKDATDNGHKNVPIGHQSAQICAVNRHKFVPRRNKKEEHEEEEEEIEQMLTKNGIFAAAAREIAGQMALAGLGVREAEEILVGTLQSIQTGMPRGDEEIISLAVDRLRRGIWDSGKHARAALRRARYGVSQDPSRLSPAPPTSPASPDDSHDIWQAALGELQLELTRATFETWLRGSRLVACEDGVFVIGVANEYARDWLEARLRPVVERVLTRLAGRKASARFVVNGGNG